MAKQIYVASKITGTGKHVPKRVVTNEHFAAYLETSDKWIRERTGISERRWVEGDTSISELAEPAAREAIKNAGLAPDDIDGIVFATVTPEMIFPSSGCHLQRRLGIKKCFAFDINAVCSGFVYALTVADGLIASGQCQHVLVVGADIFSRLVDANDRGTCILFGDGAGAAVLSATSGDVEPGMNHDPEHLALGNSSGTSGIYASEIHSDGFQADILCIPPGEQYVSMVGREVFKFAVRSLSEVSRSVVEKAGFSLDDIDFVLSHQANKRIISATASQLGIPEEKMLTNVEKYGNTSAASVPILLAEFVKNGTLKSGNLLLLNAVGGGLTWGAVLLRL